MSTVELRFAPTELLFRRIAKDQLKASQIKHSQLRLQISVCRSTQDSAEAVQDRELQNNSKFNGVAEISVEAARSVCHAPINVACIHEPTSDIPSHSLIAIWTTASPEEEIEEHVDKIRILLSRAMAVVLPPR